MFFKSDDVALGEEDGGCEGMNSVIKNKNLEFFCHFLVSECVLYIGKITCLIKNT